MKLKLWVIIDVSDNKKRFCYADSEKTNGAMAVYDKKPKIAKHWQPFKKAVKVTVELIENPKQ